MLQRHCSLVCRSFNNALANSPYTISWWIFHAIASCALSRQTWISVLEYVDCDAANDHTSYISLYKLSTRWLIAVKHWSLISTATISIHGSGTSSDHVLGDGGLLPRGMWDQPLHTVIDRNMKESAIKIEKFSCSLNKLQMHLADCGF